MGLAWVVPDPFDMDAEEPALLAVASVGKVLVRGKHQGEVRTEWGDPAGLPVGLAEHTDCRADIGHLPVLQQRDSWPTCRRPFSCHIPVESPD